MMKLKFLVILLLSFSVFAKTAFAETEFKIITLQHRFASDLLAVVTPMVGPEGTATGIDNQLILRASPQRMREIEVIVAQLDAARTNRKITIRSELDVQFQQKGIVASGNINVGKAANSSGRIDIEHNRQQSRQNSNQFINVLDGETAFIRVGQIVPFTQDWITLTRAYVQIERITDWQEISTGFAVRPRTLGNQVELTITPRISRLNQQGFIDFEALTTSLRVSLGNWVDIAGTMQQNDEISRKILGINHSSGQQNSNLTIKVD